MCLSCKRIAVPALSRPRFAGQHKKHARVLHKTAEGKRKLLEKELVRPDSCRPLCDVDPSSGVAVPAMCTCFVLSSLFPPFMWLTGCCNSRCVALCGLLGRGLSVCGVWIPIVHQLERDAAENVEKAQAALAALRVQEDALLSKMERVEDSQLLMVQKKRELARLADELDVRGDPSSSSKAPLPPHSPPFAVLCVLHPVFCGYRRFANVCNCSLKSSRGSST